MLIDIQNTFNNDNERVRRTGEIHNIIFNIFEKKIFCPMRFTSYLHNNVNK